MIIVQAPASRRIPRLKRSDVCGAVIGGLAHGFEADARLADMSVDHAHISRVTPIRHHIVNLRFPVFLVDDDTTIAKFNAKA